MLQLRTLLTFENKHDIFYYNIEQRSFKETRLRNES